MAANAFMAVSLEPPLCVVSVSKKAHLHERLLRSRRFAVSVLNQEQQYLSNHFAGWRISGMQPEFVDRAGMPTIRNAIAVITADVIESHGCGDHTLFVGEIDFMEAKGATSPLLFYRGRYAKVSREAPIGEAEPPAFW
jgi:flavin reductase (DIM6/NTAB) family NADH-FMN oxidoreductase RutF